MVGLVDTHAHLNAAAFEPDRDAVVAAALAGLAYVVDVGTDRSSSEASLALSARHDRLYSTVGAHPHDAARHDDRALADLMELADRPKVVALGEMGLDYHYDFSPRPEQRRAFAYQVQEARRRRKPVVVHIRDAFDDAYAILSEGDGVAGVLHCFTGTWEQARWALDRGMYISFSGLVTFKNAGGLRDVAARMPLDRLLLETDSPYLTPHPHRSQKRNAPPMVRVTAELVAGLRGMALADLARETTANACRLLGLPLPPAEREVAS
jgi:TatD DNase family protein